jgi:hypothetical protein
MARAVLQIDVDTSGVRRAMGDLRGTARTAQAAMTAEARRAASQRDRIARDEIRFKQRMDIETVRSQRDADRARAQSGAQASRERIAVSNREARVEVTRMQTSAQLFIASERAKTRVVEREEKQRTRAAQTEERARVSAARAAAREVTRTDRERTRAGRDIGIGLRRGLNVGGDAALNVGRVAYSQIRDARRQRADSENTLNSAFYQARLGGPEAMAARTRIETELATGSLRGMSMEDVAGGLAQAQTQFNVLAGATPQQRSAALDRQVQLLAFARNTYQSPGEVLRVAGMLEQQGVTGADQMNTIRSMTGMAQAGSIELGNVTREALGPLMQNIARSVTAGMDPAQRSRAVQSATLETMAVGEVTARAGGRSRDMLNALSKTRASITNERTQESLYARLQSQGGVEGQALAARMFTMQNGHARLNEGTSAVGFLSQLVAGFGGDVNRVGNLVGAGGAGAPMVLDSQQRRLMLLLASQGQGGQSVAQSITSMQREGATFGEADVQRGRALRDAEQLTAINAAETARLNALNDGTSSVVRFARALDDFTARNPIGSAAVQSGGGLLGGLLGGALFPRIGQALAGTRIGAAIAGTTAANSAAATGAIGGAGAGLGAAGLGVAAVAGAARTAATGDTVGGGRASTIERVNAGIAALNPATAIGEMASQFGGAVIRALAGANITATIDPVTAAHAASQNATTPARRP